MFHADTWAQSFLNVCAGSAAGSSTDAVISEGLETLQALSPLILGIKSHVSGISAARQLDGMLRHSMKQANLKDISIEESPGVEYACRLIFLLVEYGHIAHLPALIEKIQEVLNKRRSVLSGILETAFSVDEVFEKQLKDSIKEKFQVREVVLDVRIQPALLGGCRLRIGGESWDGTLKKQLQGLGQVLEGGIS